MEKKFGNATSQETIATFEEAVTATDQLERRMREGVHEIDQSHRSFIAHKNEHTATALIDSIRKFISDLSTMVENVEELKRKHAGRLR